jgi:hypothetical protein
MAEAMEDWARFLTTGACRIRLLVENVARCANKILVPPRFAASLLAEIRSNI